MRKAIGVLSALWFSCFPSAIMAQSPEMKTGQMKTVGEISGQNLRAIQAALPELERRKLDLSNYKITIVETASSIVILFADANEPPGQRGSATGLQVELDKKDLHLIRSQLGWR
jgi:hypothetical protein